MSLVKTKTNGDLFPQSVSDFFNTDFFGRPSIFDFNGNFPRFNLLNKVPSVNITETSEGYEVEIAAPGLTKKDFKIETDNDLLTISSEKKDEQEEEKENYWRKEFSYHSFSRSFHLPKNSLPEKIEAKYEDGILKLTLPKKEVSASKPKKEIKVA